MRPVGPAKAALPSGLCRRKTDNGARRHECGGDSWRTGREDGGSWFAPIRGSGKRLDDQSKSSDIEWLSRRRLYSLQALTKPAALKLQRTVMTIRIVARALEQTEPRPGATRSALVCVVAGPAEPPQIIHRAIADVAQRNPALPDFPKIVFADIATRPGRRRKGRATLYGAVRFDSKRRHPRPTRIAVPERHRPAQIHTARSSRCCSPATS